MKSRNTGNQTRNGTKWLMLLLPLMLALTGCSIWDSIFGSSSPPMAPGNFQAQSGDGQAFLSWSPSAGATGYTVYWRAGSDISMANYDDSASVGVTYNYTVGGLTGGTTYAFFVTASNSEGESSPSNFETATPSGAGALAAPTGLAATPGNGQVSLSWPAVTEATQGYKVYYRAGSTATVSDTLYSWFNPATPETTITMTVVGLTNGTQYAFVVTAVGVAGESRASSVVVATPLAPTDAYEPDNTYPVAAAITVGGAAQQHYVDAGDQDWLSFVALVGISYTIETHSVDGGTTVTDTYIELYDLGGTTRITYDDDGGAGVFSRIDWTCSVTGTYYVKVTGFSASETGPYTVDVR